MTEKVPTIPEYFSGKNILISGGTGFIGKVLIEKLLRSCSDVGKIYLLIRPKKDKSPNERVKDITDLPLFDILKQQNPDNLKKIVPIQGDVVDLGLGLSDKDKALLIDDVNIVYHIAASVRFDDSLKDAIIMNTRGTREIACLSKQMKHLDVFFYFSTTYCHTDKEVVEEKIYPALIDWQKAIDVVEQGDPNALQALSEKFIQPLTNTYTFSKSLAEHVVDDVCKGCIPAVIIRPSIVISTMLEPFTGWVDNLNGPVAMLVASDKGVLRSMYADPNIVSDYIPCDMIVKGAIIATWKKSLEKDDEKYKVSVYNGCQNYAKPITMGELVDIGKTLCWDNPSGTMLWYPDITITTCRYYHYFKMLFYQLLPALFLDFALLLLRQKPLLVKIQRRVFVGGAAVEYFLTNQWTFLNKKTISLEGLLVSTDRENFSFHRDHKLSDPFNYFSATSATGKKFLLNEISSERTKLFGRRMWFIAQFFNGLWYILWTALAYKISYVLIYRMYGVYMSLSNLFISSQNN